MDGIDSYSDPILWAGLVVLDHVDLSDPRQHSEFYLHSILVGAMLEFIVENFLEQGLEIPSKSEIVSCALALIENQKQDLEDED